LGQPEKALRCYDESIKISPVFYYGYLNKGKILAWMGQIEEAKTALSKALKLARKNNDKLNTRRIQKELRRISD